MGKSCNNCRFYAELKIPYQRSDEVRIFGYCFGEGDKDYSPNMGKGFPVFIDGGGAACKSHKRKKSNDEQEKEQSTVEARRGEWEQYISENGSVNFRCSACRKYRFHNGEMRRKYFFCPGCGANMIPKDKPRMVEQIKLF